MTEENVFMSDDAKYYGLVKGILQRLSKESKPKAFVRTYGCQQNVSDSERLKGMLSLMGFELTNEINSADMIIFNTCAVREHAEDRVFGNVGALKSLKKKKPGLVIALCGCMMEQKHVVEKIKSSYPFVDLVFGTHSLKNFPMLIYKVLCEKKRIFESTINNKKIAENLPIKRDNPFKAFVPVMYGCDNFCSYCVVPYVRGRERSRDSSDILQEIYDLINNGYKDIMLLGQNVNSYGKNLEERINFSELLRKIDSFGGDYWLRFMTSHPKDATKDLIDAIANSTHICRHLHLPFQSGSDRILKLMNRKYTKEKYLDIINYAKNKIPGVSITSDVIVGFPGETYEDFCETLSLVKEVGFTSLFTFIYSKRVGTPAAKMDDPISDKEKSEWFDELLRTQNDIAAKQLKKYEGKTLKVLIENTANGQGKLTARTEGNIIVDMSGDVDLIGKFALAEIVEVHGCVLKGKLVTIL